MSTRAKKGVRLLGTDKIIAAMGAAAQRPQGEAVPWSGPPRETESSQGQSPAGQEPHEYTHFIPPPPRYVGVSIRYPSCHFCGKRDADVEPLLPGMLATCPECLRKVVLWGLSFSASLEREKKK